MEFSFDSETLATLMAFGMPEPRAKRSMMVCESEEAMKNVEALMNWCLEHASVPGIDAPIDPEEEAAAVRVPGREEEAKAVRGQGK